MEFDDREEGIEFQHIRARIRNTLNLPVDNLGEPSGAPTTTDVYASKLGEPKDDLVSIFKHTLNVGTPEYEHELATFMHKGPPKLRYEYVKEEDIWIDHADPITKAKEAEYFEERKKEKERRARIADKLKVKLTATKKENTNPNPNTSLDGKYDFACYTPSCKFESDSKADYEKHVVTTHLGTGLCYPGKIDIKTRGWTAQGRTWEI